MARETRHGKGSYLTRSRRDGRRVKREYYGNGPAADLVEALDGLDDLAAQKHADWWRAEQERCAIIDEKLSEFFKTTVMLIRAKLLDNGLRKHPTKWRFSRMSYDAYRPDGELLDTEELALALEKAEEGDPEALASVRRWIRNPGTWEDAWSSAIRSTQMMVATMTQADPVQTISLNDQLDTLRAKWTGSTPTRLERLLVERLALAWLNVMHSQAFATSSNRPRLTKAQKNALDVRQSDAQKQLTLAKKLLVLVRKDLPVAVRRREKQYAQSELKLAEMDQPMDGDDIAENCGTADTSD